MTMSQLIKKKILSSSASRAELDQPGIVSTVHSEGPAWSVIAGQ